MYASITRSSSIQFLVCRLMFCLEVISGSEMFWNLVGWHASHYKEEHTVCHGPRWLQDFQQEGVQNYPGVRGRWLQNRGLQVGYVNHFNSDVCWMSTKFYGRPSCAGLHVYSNQNGIKAKLDGKAAINAKQRADNIMAEVSFFGLFKIDLDIIVSFS